MFKRFGIITTLLILSACATTNQKTHQQLAATLLDITSPEEVMIQTMEMSFEPLLQELKLSGEPSEKLIKIESLINSFISKFVNDPDLKPKIVELYIEEFSQPELQEVLDFYETPTGQKTLEKIPLLFQKGGEIGIQIAEKHQAQFARDLDLLLNDDCDKSCN